MQRFRYVYPLTILICASLFAQSGLPPNKIWHDLRHSLHLVPDAIVVANIKNLGDKVDHKGRLPVRGLGFAPAVDYTSGGDFSYSIATADVNLDGKPDLVITNSCEGIPNCNGTVGVLLGNGDGTFQQAITYGSGGFWAYALAVADVNRDGRPDLLVANTCEDANCRDGGIGVLLGNGDGTFQPAMSYDSGGYRDEGSGSYGLAVADINGDGKPDLLIVNECVGGSGCANGIVGAVGVLLGNGDGTFQASVIYNTGGYLALSVAVADLNGDGKPDLAVANGCASSDCSLNNGVVGVLLGNGDGTFQPPISYGSGGAEAESVAVADLNGDGKADLVVGNASGCSDYVCNGTIGVLLGNGDGTFQSTETYGSGYGTVSVTVGDVNGDHRPDVIVADECESSEGSCAGAIGVLLGNGDGSFQNVVTYGSGGSGAGWVVASDVNGDGRPDLLIANQCANSNCSGDASAGVLLNFTTPPAFATILGFMGPNGGVPLGNLIQGADGDAYGTSSYSNGGGTVYKINEGGAMTVLYNFCGLSNCTDGMTPLAGLVLASDGNFYGTTSEGGAHSNGTVFQITSKGILTTLYSFCSQASCADGAAPYGGLVQASDGNLYGTTSGGGGNNAGTVFRISMKGAVDSLYSFCAQSNCMDGAAPRGGLLQANDGNLYGITFEGGTANDGTVFRISTEGQLTSLHSFNGSDGYQPVAGLVQATDGNLYGTTDSGGAENSNCPYGCGTVFRITSEGMLTTIHSFCGQANCADGLSPQSALAQATDGNLYGTTFAGGRVGPSCSSGCGTVFTMSLQGTIATLHQFCAKANCADGYGPLTSLKQATTGKLYGTTFEGGSFASGTIFDLDMGLRPFVAFVSGAGKVGQIGGILGQGFTGNTAVTLNGIPASFTVVSDTFIKATVPAGATTGYVTVATPTGTLTSNVPFHVIP